MTGFESRVRKHTHDVSSAVDSGRRPWTRSFLLLAAGESATSLLRTIGLLWIARSLGPAAFGTLSVGFVVGRYVIALSHPGLAVAGKRGVALHPESTPTYLREIVGSRVLFSSIMLLGAIPAFAVRIDRDLRFVSIAFCLMMLTQSIDTRWSFIGLQRVGAVAVVSTIGGVAYLLAALLFVHDPGDIVVAAVIYVVCEAFTSSLLIAASSQQHGRWWRKPSTGSWRPLWREARPFTLTYLARTLMATIDVVVVKALRDGDEAGQYAAASRIFVIALLFINHFSDALLPSFVKAAETGRATLMAATRSALKRALTVTPLAAVLAILLTPHVVPRVLGREYRPAVAMLQLLIVAVVIATLNGVIAINLIAARNERILARLVPVGLVANIAMNLFLVPTIGAMGAAGATIFTELIMLAIGSAALFNLPWGNGLRDGTGSTAAAEK